MLTDNELIQLHTASEMGEAMVRHPFQVRHGGDEGAESRLPGPTVAEL